MEDVLGGGNCKEKRGALSFIDSNGKMEPKSTLSRAGSLWCMPKCTVFTEHSSNDVGEKEKE